MPPVTSTTTSRLHRLALPVAGLNLLGVVTLMVDTAMAGHLPHGTVALAALGYASQLVFAWTVVTLGLTVGAVSLTARAFGADDAERVNRVFGDATLLCACLSVGIAALGNASASVFLSGLGAAGETHRVALLYLRPLLGGVFFYAWGALLAGTLSAVGNTWLPFVVGLVSVLINIPLNWALMFGHLGLPPLGVVGAAWGTLAAQALSVFLSLALVRAGHAPPVRARWPAQAPRTDNWRKLLRVGLPATLDLALLMLSFVVMVRVLAWVSDTAVAAHVIGLRIHALLLVPALALSRATSALVGNALGAQDVREARQVLRASIASGLVVLIALSALLVLVLDPVLALFHVAADSPVYVPARTWLLVLALTTPLLAVHLSFTGLFRGAGATGTSLLINLVGTLLIQAPLSFVLAFPAELGALGVWLALPIAVVIRVLLDVWGYLRARWATPGT